MKIIAIAAASVFSTMLVAGCGESDKAPVTYKRGEYQGKPDTPPWTNAPNQWSGPTWTPGDRSSWEDALRTRTITQNDYARVE